MGILHILNVYDLPKTKKQELKEESEEVSIVTFRIMVTSMGYQQEGTQKRDLVDLAVLNPALKMGSRFPNLHVIFMHQNLHSPLYEPKVT